MTIGNPAPLSSDVNVVFGIHAVEELISRRPHEIDRIYFEYGKTSADIFRLLKLCRKLRIACQQTPAPKLDALASTVKHQGVVALCSIKAYSSLEQLDELIKNAKTPPILIVPASIEDPRNLGALIRSSVAFGVTALLLERKNTTLLGSVVAKASAGMVEHLPVLKPRNLEGLLIEMKKKGFFIIGGHQHATLRPDEVDLTGPLIFIVGGEHRDIPPYLQKLCERLIGIPIVPPATSLNVSVAGAVLLYECQRQRRGLTNRITVET